MAFVNECISKEDYEKYGLNEVNKRFVVGGTKARDWTVDHERNIYLRNVANGREEFRHISTWTLYWNGNLIPLELHMVDSGGEYKGACWSHKKIQHLWLPDHLKGKRDEVIEILREALLAYKDGGVYAKATSYDLILADRMLRIEEMFLNQRSSPWRL